MAVRPSVPDLEPYRERRRRVCERIGNGVVVLYGGDLKTRSNDTEFRFRPDTNFHYLTALSEPGAVMVLRGGDAPALTLFVRPRDPEAEVWSGRRIGPEGAREQYGADATFEIGDLAKELPGLIDGADELHLPLGQYPAFDRKVLAAVAKLRRRDRFGEQAPEIVRDARVTLGEDRIVKDAHALESLRRAAEISAAAHIEAMKHVRPGMYEYEIEALIEYEFRRLGSSGPGYGTIVGAGDNATILHYVENDSCLEAGDILLIDAGAEWNFFSGDITRSYPVTGKLTPAQRDLYELVLRTNEAGIAATTVGTDIDAIHHMSIRMMCEGLKDMGIVDDDLDEYIESEGFKKYYMHRTSHWLGADVHDAGHYCLERKPRPLQPGFVLTIEPALYIPADDEAAPEELRGTGIRIEDDVLVTAEGPEVLTAAAPKQVAELEDLIGSAYRE